MTKDSRFRWRGKNVAVGKVEEKSFWLHPGVNIAVGQLDEDYEWMMNSVRPHEIERFIWSVWEAYQEYLRVGGRYAEFGNIGLKVERKK